MEILQDTFLICKIRYSVLIVLNLINFINFF